jgi:hypothetical protein
LDSAIRALNVISNPLLVGVLKGFGNLPHFFYFFGALEQPKTRALYPLFGRLQGNRSITENFSASFSDLDEFADSRAMYREIVFLPQDFSDARVSHGRPAPP